MPISLEGNAEARGLVLAQHINAPFVTRCQCGQEWTVCIERGEAGRAGCVQCNCGAELVSWSGSVVFTASVVPSA